MITKEETIKKNLDLLNEFMKYAFDHPDVLDTIPFEAELVILPIDDPELCHENKKTAESLVKRGNKVVIIEFEKPKAISPKIEFLMAQDEKVVI